MSPRWRWLTGPYTAPEPPPGAASPPAPLRPVYGDELLREQVYAAVVIAATSPEPHHLAGP
jgi:hypothetical protein